MRYFIGIDPGMNKQYPGAWAYITEDLSAYGAYLWPEVGITQVAADWQHMVQEEFVPDLAVLERQQVMPKQGAVTGGKIMENYGQWQGLLLGLGVPYRIENAKTWQAHILDAGKGRHKGREAVKKASVEHVQRLFPGVDISRKKDWGKADAINMALFARKIFQTL